MPDQPILYFVRHGRTEANVERRFAGWSDDPLDEVGRDQAAALAERLSAEGIEHVFTSPVRRAVETARILAEAWDGSLHTVHDLREIEIGPWKGLTEDEVEAAFPEAYERWRRAPAAFELDGREPLAAVRERALRGADQIARALLSGGPSPAVAVTHLAVLRVLWLTARGRDLAHYHEVEGPFCEVFPLRWEGRGKLAASGSAPAESASGRDEPGRPEDVRRRR